LSQLAILLVTRIPARLLLKRSCLLPAMWRLGTLGADARTGRANQEARKCARGHCRQVQSSLFEIDGRKPRDSVGSMSNRQCMDMADEACYRAIEARDRRFDGCLFVAALFRISHNEATEQKHSPANKHN
jgi:hypothetical protein